MGFFRVSIYSASYTPRLVSGAVTHIVRGDAIDGVANGCARKTVLVYLGNLGGGFWVIRNLKRSRRIWPHGITRRWIVGGMSRLSLSLPLGANAYSFLKWSRPYRSWAADRTRRIVVLAPFLARGPISPDDY